MTLIVGSNLDPQPVPGMKMQRWYNGWLNTMPWVNNGGPMPPDWPGSAPGKPGGLLCASIQPPPQQLIAGSLDTDIRRFISGAPKGAMLTIWHEAEGQRYPGIDANVMKQMHHRMLYLTRGSNVKYGCANCGDRAANTAWDIPGLDYYGIDIYDAVNFNIGHAEALNRYLYNVTGLQANPTIAVLECNSHIPARRPYVFSTIASWLRRQSWQGDFTTQRDTCMLTYWNPGGALSGPWIPDVATVNALEAIVAEETEQN